MHLLNRIKLMYKMPRTQQEVLHTKTVKVLLMGKSRVGKTSIIQKLCHEQISRQHEATVYDVHTKEVNVEEYNVTMQFMELGGCYEFPSMQEVFIRHAHIFVLVYAADDADSFAKMIEIRNLVSRIKEKHSTELPMIVVRNKCDKHVSRVKGASKNKKSVRQWCYCVHDVSAKTELCINAVMDSLIEESKFIGNSNETVKLQYSGRYVYNNKLDDLEKVSQFHKSRTLLQNYDNSDEMMEKRRSRSIVKSTLSRSSSLRRASSFFKSFRKRKRQQDNEAISLEITPSSPAQRNPPEGAERPFSRFPSFSSASPSSSPLVPRWRKKSISSNDLPSLITPDSGFSESFLAPTQIPRNRSQSDASKRHRKTSRLEIVHTTMPADRVSLISRSLENNFKAETLPVVSKSNHSDDITESEDEQLRARFRNQLRRKIVSTGDLSKINYKTPQHSPVYQPKSKTLELPTAAKPSPIFQRRSQTLQNKPSGSPLFMRRKNTGTMKLEIPKRVMSSAQRKERSKSTVLSPTSQALKLDDAEARSLTLQTKRRASISRQDAVTSDPQNLVRKSFRKISAFVMMNQDE